MIPLLITVASYLGISKYLEDDNKKGMKGANINDLLEKKLILKSDNVIGLGSPANIDNFRRLFKTMPQPVINYIVKNFNNIYGSPFSSSIYSKDGQSWTRTPAGQIRVSDHWNFYSRNYNDPDSVDRLHASTNKEVFNNTHWTVAKKNDKTGEYDVILSLPLKGLEKKVRAWSYDQLETKEKGEVLQKHLNKLQVKKYIASREKEFRQAARIASPFSDKRRKDMFVRKAISLYKKFKSKAPKKPLKGRGYDRVEVSNVKHRGFKDLFSKYFGGHFDTVSERIGRNNFNWTGIISPELDFEIEKFYKKMGS